MIKNTKNASNEINLATYEKLVYEQNSPAPYISIYQLIYISGNGSDKD